MFTSNQGAVSKPRLRADDLPLSLYKEKPDAEISLEEFERYALDRIQGGRRERNVLLSVHNQPFAPILMRITIMSHGAQ